jgi:hypothetical protein
VSKVVGSLRREGNFIGQGVVLSTRRRG